MSFALSLAAICLFFTITAFHVEASARHGKELHKGHESYPKTHPAQNHLEHLDSTFHIWPETSLAEPDEINMSTSTDIAPTNQYRPLSEDQLQGVASKSLFKFARSKYPNPHMSHKEWLSLIIAGDQKALNVIELFKGKARQYRRQASIRRRLEAEPTDANLIQETEASQAEMNAIKQKIRAAKNNFPTSRQKKDVLRSLIFKLHQDIKLFQENGELSKFVPFRERRATGNAVEENDLKCARGNLEADRVISKLRGARRLFHLAPYHPFLKIMIEDLNNWMHLNKPSYTKYTLPEGTHASSQLSLFRNHLIEGLITKIIERDHLYAKQIHSEEAAISIENEHESPHTPFTAAELHQMYPTKAHRARFIDSLFDDDTDDELYDI